LATDDKNTGETMPRNQFLEQEINPFLHSVGFAEWNFKSPLYNDWFLGEIMKQDDAQRRRASAWRFIRKISKSELRQRLEQLLKQCADDASCE